MKIRKTYLIALLLLMLFSNAHAQYVPNIDFETGTTTNWKYYRGTYETKKGFTSPTWNLVTCGAVPKLHTLTNQPDTDLYCGFPVVADGRHSLRLGTDTGGFNADGAEFTVRVPPTGAYSLIYHYAFVTDDHSHSDIDRARLEVRVVDSATGIAIPCDSLTIIGRSAGFLTALSGLVAYLPWTADKIDLAAFPGKTLVVRFKTSGCSLGGHFGYGYIDMTGIYANKLNTCASSSIILKGPAGYASYRWCDSVTLGTTIDTLQNITVAAPVVRTTYAVIVTPYPGYGCPDTLYTLVEPFIVCSGTPPTGISYSALSSICGIPDRLSVVGYHGICGLSFQWQRSLTGVLWSDVGGATDSVYNYYRPDTAGFYRCATTCTVSGLTTYSSSVYVPAAVITGMYEARNPADHCLGAEFYVQACGRFSKGSVVTYYGDGTSDRHSLSLISRDVDFVHSYDFSGTYSVKQILYDDTLRVDSTRYSYKHNGCNVLSVEFYIDFNGNCLADLDETNFVPITVEIDSDGVAIDTMSVTSGLHYTTYAAPGTIYQFKVINSPSAIGFACPTTSIITDTIPMVLGGISTKYIGFTCKPAAIDLEEHTIIPITGTKHQVGNVFVHANNPCLPFKSATVTVNCSPKYNSTVSTIPFATSFGSTIQWIIKDLTAKPLCLYYDVRVTLGSLTIGDTVHTHVTIDPVVGDVNPTDNEEIIIDTVRAGCDPNFILVSPSGCISSGVLPNQLLYTVHFENTGNDTAHNIYVLDTLPDNVDVRSLEVVDASAKMNVATFRSGGYNIVKFDFPGIKLLDSSHHGLCNGMVMFNIKTIAGLPIGATINNRVGIYFDINPVVLTNTVSNVIGCPALPLVTAENHEPHAHVFPNPATDELTIKMTRDAYTSFTITNQVGQVLIEQQITTPQTKVNIKTLAPGLYYITLRGENGTSVQKFVKL